MLCVGCDTSHGYRDAIPVSHKIDNKWKSDLLKYYQERDGIPKGISFLALEEYVQSQNIAKSAKKRSTNNSNKTNSTQVKKKKKTTQRPNTRKSNRRHRVS